MPDLLELVIKGPHKRCDVGTRQLRCLELLDGLGCIEVYLIKVELGHWATEVAGRRGLRLFPCLAHDLLRENEHCAFAPAVEVAFSIFIHVRDGGAHALHKADGVVVIALQ